MSLQTGKPDKMYIPSTGHSSPILNALTMKAMASKKSKSLLNQAKQGKKIKQLKLRTPL